MATLQCLNEMEERCLHNRACTHSLVKIAQLTCQKAHSLSPPCTSRSRVVVCSVERSLQRLFRRTMTMDRAFLPPRTVDRAFLPRTTTAMVAMLASVLAGAVMFLCGPSLPCVDALSCVDAATPGRVCATLAMLNCSSATAWHLECLCDVAVRTSGQCTSGQCESHVRAHNVACTAKDIDCDDPTAGSVAASSSSTTASNCTASATTGGSVGWVMYDTENDKALDVVRAHVEWLGCLRDDAESGNVCADVDSCSWAYDTEQRAGGV